MAQNYFELPANITGSLGTSRADLLFKAIDDVLITSQGAGLPRGELILGALCIDALRLRLQALHRVLLLPNLLSQLLLFRTDEPRNSVLFSV